MNAVVPLVAGAVLVLAAIGCVTGRRPALVALATGVLLAAAPLLADPLPPVAILLERAVGAALAAEILWLGFRGRQVAGASALGWPPMALLAGAAAATGVGAQPLVSGSGPPIALGAALALFTIAIVAVVRRSDGVQLAMSGLVLLVATSVLRLAMSGPPSALETLLVAGLGVAMAGAIGLLVPHEPASPVEGGRAGALGEARAGDAGEGGLEATSRRARPGTGR